MKQKMKEENKFDSLFIKCDCTTHCFEIERFSFVTDLDEGFYLSLWNLNRVGRILNWKNRIRWIWHIVRTGELWTDNIIISNEKAKQIVEYINKHLEKK